MSIVWADGFQHYGVAPNGGRDAMLSGAWAAFEGGTGELPAIVTTQARTGTRSLRIWHRYGATVGCKGRRVIGSARTVIGCAQGVYFESLPSQNGLFGFEFRTPGNNSIAMVTVQSDGALGLYTGSGRTLIASTDPVIVATAWQHIETKMVIDNLVGSFEIRVDGTTVLQMTNIDLGTIRTSQAVFGMPAITGPSFHADLIYYIDDVVVWDDLAGTNDFIGACRVETLMPTADTVEADWVKVGATDGWDCINETTPDGDTTYIMSDTAGQMSEFEIANSPPETFNIKGVFVPIMGKLGAAGTANVKVSAVSGADVADGAEITFTTSYTYWSTSFEVDPATGLAWTKPAVDALKIRVEKTL